MATYEVELLGRRFQVQADNQNKALGMARLHVAKLTMLSNAEKTIQRRADTPEPNKFLDFVSRFSGVGSQDDRENLLKTRVAEREGAVTGGSVALPIVAAGPIAASFMAAPAATAAAVAAGYAGEQAGGGVGGEVGGLAEDLGAPKGTRAVLRGVGKVAGGLVGGIKGPRVLQEVRGALGAAPAVAEAVVAREIPSVEALQGIGAAARAEAIAAGATAEKAQEAAKATVMAAIRGGQGRMVVPATTGIPVLSASDATVALKLQQQMGTRSGRAVVKELVKDLPEAEAAAVKATLARRQGTMATNLGGHAKPGPPPTAPDDLEAALRASIKPTAEGGSEPVLATLKPGPKAHVSIVETAGELPDGTYVIPGQRVSSMSPEAARFANSGENATTLTPETRKAYNFAKKYAQMLSKSERFGDKIWIELDAAGAPKALLTPGQAGAATRAGRPTTWINNIWGQAKKPPLPRAAPRVAEPLTGHEAAIEEATDKAGRVRWSKVPDAPKDPLGNPILPGQEGWTPEQRQLARATAEDAARSAAFEERTQPTGRFPILNAEGQIDYDVAREGGAHVGWYGVTSAKRGTALENVAASPKQIVEALKKDKGNPIELEAMRAADDFNQETLLRQEIEAARQAKRNKIPF